MRKIGKWNLIRKTLKAHIKMLTVRTAGRYFRPSSKRPSSELGVSWWFYVISSLRRQSTPFSNIVFFSFLLFPWSGSVIVGGRNITYLMTTSNKVKKVSVKRHIFGTRYISWAFSGPTFLLWIVRLDKNMLYVCMYYVVTYLWHRYL